MSLDFVKSNVNIADIQLAIRQQEQLSYLTQSKIQESYLSVEYLNNWASRNFETNDAFLNYVKSILKIESFISFYKYLRFPLPSSRLISKKIVPSLKRVFMAGDSFFKYSVKGVDLSRCLEVLKIDEFNEKIFEAILYKHNSIIIEDLEDTNKPFRRILELKDVVSIKYDFECDEIEKIAFKGIIEDANGNDIRGYIYIDEKSYIFYDEKDIVINKQDHDLGRCPATFILKKPFSDKPIVKESIFSHSRELLEEYNFLKTLQKMTDPNGAIASQVMLEVENENEKTDAKKEEGEPSSDFVMGSQRSKQYKDTAGSTNALQAGSIVRLPVTRKDDGSLDMDLIQNFAKFYYIPVDALEYLNKRITDIENNIVSTLVGDFVSSDESAKNKTQIEKGISVLEDVLRNFSLDLSRIRKISDTNILGLAFGIKRIEEVCCFYGSDFFLESQSMLYDIFQKAPNPIERKTILVRIAQTRNKNNHEQMNRSEILYNLMPFCSDVDFERAIPKIDDITFAYQSRFNYWISLFEANFGDIVSFFNSMETASTSEKYITINNFIINLIKSNNENSKVESV